MFGAGASASRGKAQVRPVFCRGLEDGGGRSRSRISSGTPNISPTTLCFGLVSSSTGVARPRSESSGFRARRFGRHNPRLVDVGHRFLLEGAVAFEVVGVFAVELTGFEVVLILKIDLAQSAVGVGALIIGFGILRIQTNRVGQIGDRQIQSPRQMLSPAPQQIGRRVLRVLRNRFATGGDRWVPLAATQKQPGLVPLAYRPLGRRNPSSRVTRSRAPPGSATSHRHRVEKPASLLSGTSFSNTSIKAVGLPDSRRISFRGGGPTPFIFTCLAALGNAERRSHHPGLAVDPSPETIRRRILRGSPNWIRSYF